ncbi:MAG: VWA domain-containing protein [Candidatus Yanofskybacteria bacterium]|nr:VWA domain-containing protein [Candidatus Yanofskybacteria bacterium]
MKVFIFILTFVSILPWLAKAQVTAEPAYDKPIFSAEVDMVNVTVVALSAGGKPLPQLEKQNFKLEESLAGGQNFRERNIKLDQPEQLPLRGGIIIDTSGSTARQFRYQLDVASELVKWIIKAVGDKKRGDKFFVAEFYYESLDLNPSQGAFTLKQDWSDDSSALVRAIVRKTKKAAGTSPLFGSVRFAAEKFKKEARGNFANFLIIVADGQDNVALADLKESTYRAQAVDLPIYTIGTAKHDIDSFLLDSYENNLKQISQLTGGRFFDLPEQNKLPEIARQVLQDLRNQYHLSYELSPDYKDGDEVKIRVRVGNVSSDGKWQPLPAKLLHREGYLVTKSH